MRRQAVCFLYICIFLTMGCDKAFTPRPLPPIEVYFSPKGGCTDAIIKEIDAAKSNVLMQAYSFTSSPIAKAIADARRRGVHVEVVLDEAQRTDKYSVADFLYHADIPVLIDCEHDKAHNKIIIVDGQVVITGSFNFSKSAENGNAENLLVIRDVTIADKYTANWKLHAEHSEQFVGKSDYKMPVKKSKK